MKKSGTELEKASSKKHASACVRVHVCVQGRGVRMKEGRKEKG